MGQVEHPGPNMSFSHGDAEAQEEQGQLPGHLGHEESRWLERGGVIQDCQDPGPRQRRWPPAFHPAFYSAGGGTPPNRHSVYSSNRVGGDN